MSETPRVLSVSVASSRSVPWKGQTVRTGIFKVPTEDRVGVHRLGLEGDEQADLQVHGGPLKAVYAYPSEHYPFWRDELPGTPLPWGAFGENLTVAGLSEGGCGWATDSGSGLRCSPRRSRGSPATSSRSS